MVNMSNSSACVNGDYSCHSCAASWLITHCSLASSLCWMLPMKALGVVRSSFFWNDDPHQTLELIYIPLCMLVVLRLTRWLLPSPHSWLTRCSLGLEIWNRKNSIVKCIAYSRLLRSVLVLFIIYLIIQEPFSWDKRRLNSSEPISSLACVKVSD